jgi:hypothetical protein
MNTIQFTKSGTHYRARYLGWQSAVFMPDKDLRNAERRLRTFNGRHHHGYAGRTRHTVDLTPTVFTPPPGSILAGTYSQF